MEKYIGTKIVLAEPMDDATFSLTVGSVRHVVEIGPDGKGQPGYLVVYEDGYKSWSPKETFERANRKITAAELALLADDGEKHAEELPDA